MQSRDLGSRMVESGKGKCRKCTRERKYCVYRVASWGLWDKCFFERWKNLIIWCFGRFSSY